MSEFNGKSCRDNCPVNKHLAFGVRNKSQKHLMFVHTCSSCDEVIGWLSACHICTRSQTFSQYHMHDEIRRSHIFQPIAENRLHTHIQKDIASFPRHFDVSFLTSKNSGVVTNGTCFLFVWNECYFIWHFCG